MQYPVRLTKDDNDTFLVEVPDIPEAVTFGDTKEEALARASDAIATALEAYIKDRRPIPAPSSTKGYVVTLPALMDAKIELYKVMQDQKVGKAELGRRLNWHLPQVDRLLNVRHGSQFDQLESAFRAMGKRLSIRLDDDFSGMAIAKAARIAAPSGRMASQAPRRHAVVRTAPSTATTASGRLGKAASKKR